MVMKSYPVIDIAATGANICRLRKAKGLSIADLQAYFGFDAPQAIYKWQQGKSLPSTDNLFALSHLLEVPIDKILIPVRPKFQVLPQEKSCGDHFFGIVFSPLSTNGSMTMQVTDGKIKPAGGNTWQMVNKIRLPQSQARFSEA